MNRRTRRRLVARAVRVLAVVFVASTLLAAWTTRQARGDQRADYLQMSERYASEDHLVGAYFAAELAKRLGSVQAWDAQFRLQEEMSGAAFQRCLEIIRDLYGPEQVRAL